MTARAAAAAARELVAERLAGAVRDELEHRRQHPCATAAYMITMLGACSRFWRPWYRWQVKRWNAKCAASGHANACGMEK